MHEYFTLSVEQIIQCDSSDSGCSGGLVNQALTYVQAPAGITTGANYPYSQATFNGTTGTCMERVPTPVVSVLDSIFVIGEEAMGSHVYSTGPLSVCLDASTWMSYTGNIKYLILLNNSACVRLKHSSCF